VADDDPFLAAVEARPADDAARLAYADWLDEHARPAEAAFLQAEVRWQRRVPGAAGWFALGRELLRTAHATPDDWRERVSRPRLAGTTWRWVNPEYPGAAELTEFRSGGTLRHRDDSEEEWAEQSSGSWRQFGPRVLLTINNFSIHRGTAGVDSLPLRGREIAAGASPSYWHWTLTPPPGPDGVRNPR
jgi:uncharacterized protein (TIGR02996 family)